MTLFRFAAMITLGLALAATAAGAAEIREKTLRLTVKPGETVAIARHFRFDRYCIAIRPRITVTTPPRLGALSTREAMMELTPRITDDRRCRGHVIKAIDVIYAAAPDAKGEDVFRYERLTSDHFDAAYIVTITVE